MPKPQCIRFTHTLLMIGLGHTWPSEPNVNIFNACPLHWHNYFLGLVAIENQTTRVISTWRGAIPIDHLLQVMQQRNIAHVFVAGTVAGELVDAIVAAPPDLPLYHLHTIQTGGAAVPLSVSNKLFKHRPDVRLRVLYGLTDVGGVITLSDDWSPPGSAGRLCPYTSAIVIDASCGERFGPDRIGEVCIRRPCWLPRDNNEPPSDDYVPMYQQTGDMGKIDERGNVFLIGRNNDYIKYCRYQIDPGELERFVLDSFAAVVRSCVVVGIPTGLLVLVPAAVVVLHENGMAAFVSQEKSENGAKIRKKDHTQILIDRIKNLVRETYKDVMQLRGGVVIAEQLPRTAAHKVRLNVVQQMAVDYHAANVLGNMFSAGGSTGGG